jgi:AAA+ superfamily predicted ATPase
MEASNYPSKRKLGDAIIEETEFSSPLHAHLLQQTLEFVEGALRELVYPLNRTACSKECTASARDKLVRASTLLEAMSGSQIGTADWPAPVFVILPAVKRILNMLIMLPCRLSSQNPQPAELLNPSSDSCAPFSGAEEGRHRVQSGDLCEGEDIECASEDESSSSDVSKLRLRGFIDVIGNEAAKQVLYDNVVLPLNLSDEIRRTLFTGIRSGVGNVLLFGPPGTGKTMLVAAASLEANARLVLIKPSDILSKYNGESEAALKRIFSMARKHNGNARKRRPIVLFFDEFDSLACSRNSVDDGVQGRRLLAELLLQLNELKALNAASWEGNGQCCAVVVVAATNRIEDIDEAAVRRFDTRVYVGLPETTAERVQLILSFLSPGNVLHSCSPDDFLNVARLTEGWSGSDIECMCRDAAMAPLRRMFPLFGSAISLQVGGACAAAVASSMLITAEDFYAACERAMSLAPRSSIKVDDCCAEE